MDRFVGSYGQWFTAGVLSIFFVRRCMFGIVLPCAQLSYIPAIFPCWCLGDRKFLQDAWGLVPGSVRVLLVEAES